MEVIGTIYRSAKNYKVFPSVAPVVGCKNCNYGFREKIKTIKKKF